MSRCASIAGSLVLLGAALLPGCGGDASGKSAAPFSSGLTQSELLGALADADVTRLCTSLSNYFLNDPGFAEARCRVVGFEGALSASFLGASSDADVQKACSDLESACRSAKPTEIMQTCAKPPGDCTATVAEFESCVSDFIDAATKAFDAVPVCNGVTRATFQMASSGQGAPTQAQPPPSCQTLEAKCPGAQASTGLAADTMAGSPSP